MPYFWPGLKLPRKMWARNFLDHFLTKFEPKSPKIAKMACHFFRGACFFWKKKRKSPTPKHMGCLLDKNRRRQPWLQTRHLLCPQPRKLQHLTSQYSRQHPGVAPSAFPPQGVVDEIETSGIFSAAATDVLALDATDVFSADTTEVFSAAKAASGGSCPAENTGSVAESATSVSKWR